MNAIAIRADKLSKSYRIGRDRGRKWRKRGTIAADLNDLVRGIFQKDSGFGKETFWALKDISFEAEEGDVIGIIGRNGAGKSTLLKLLAQITEPTTGYVDVYGRVGSLLEVGTGFHSELTGRQNIFIMGSILGMRQAEIKRKFDEIVSFSGVGSYLDTPVKRYSSGMEVRLAFAIGAHLEPEILLIDEVLSVGDAAFRKKSLEKIREVSQDGRTVLFVSHNMQTVASLCNKAMVLEQGEILFQDGVVSNAIDFYHRMVEDRTALQLSGSQVGKDQIQVVKLGIYDGQGKVQENIVSGQPLEFRIELSANEALVGKEIEVAIEIKSFSGNFISNLESKSAHGPIILPSQTGTLICKIDKMPLAPGNITIALLISTNGMTLYLKEDILVAKVEVGDFYKTGESGQNPGAVFIEHEWSLRQ